MSVAIRMVCVNKEYTTRLDYAVRSLINIGRVCNADDRHDPADDAIAAYTSLGEVCTLYYRHIEPYEVV